MWTCRVTVVALALVQAWTFRFDANPDGVSYLDVADAYREGRWGDAPNGYWSPMYSWLLALALTVLRSGPSADFAVAHAVNFGIFVLVLLSFEYFLRGVVALPGVSPTGDVSGRPDWVILGYGLFAWATISLIRLAAITPDLLTAAGAFAIGGLLARMRVSEPRRRHAAAFGFVAGASYLSKAAAFPLTIFVLLPVAGVLWHRHRRAPSMLSVAVLCFAVVIAPYVIGLSRAKGKATFGETGRVAYAWIVNAVPGQVHWQGEPPGRGVPRHPTRRVATDPDTYEFATPLLGTYPPWYDPSYWYEGVRISFDPVTHLRIAYRYLPLILTLLAPPLVVVAGALLASRSAWVETREYLARAWWLILPGVAAVAMYASIFLETRYVGAFVVLVWVGALLTAEYRVSHAWRQRLYAAGALALTLWTLPAVTARRNGHSPDGQNEHGNAASFVLSAGVRPGGRVAIIGDGLYAYWARLARVRLVAEIPARETADFWTADHAKKQMLFEKFRQAGATAVIARNPPPGSVTPTWRISPDGRLAVLPLSN